MDYNDAVNAVALVAERKILEAMAEGRFDNLPGQGRPQKLEDLSHLPPEMRLSYLILKNSGYLEGSAESANNLRDMLAQSGGEARDCGKIEKLKYLLSRRPTGSAAKNAPNLSPEISGEDEDLAALNPEYLDKMLRRV